MLLLFAREFELLNQNKLNHVKASTSYLYLL